MEHLMYDKESRIALVKAFGRPSSDGYWIIQYSSSKYGQYRNIGMANKQWAVETFWGYVRQFRAGRWRGY